MKPIMPFEWKAQRRVLWTLLLGVTALWAMPRSTRAQLYVSDSNGVGEYNATTGAAVNANFITGLFDSMGIALSDNNLFVGTGGFALGTGTVGKYNAATGAAINANFITG
jgi:hypothetical protein